MKSKQAAFSIVAVGLGFCVLLSLINKTKQRRLQRQVHDQKAAQADWENEGGAALPV